MPNLSNFIDIHIHTSPDIRERKLDDIKAAKMAAQEGMKALVFKSHVASTAERAIIAALVVEGIKIFGSLSLNHPVGGLNPFAVEASLSLGAKIIWLPTKTAKNHRRFHGQEDGIRVIDDDGPAPALFDIFELVRAADAVLATGHISVEEIVRVVPLAYEAGVFNILITHPEVPWINMPIDIQRSLLKYDVLFERCFASTFAVGGGVSLEKISNPIKELGASSTIISTDFGAAALAAPTEGYKAYIEALRSRKISDADIFLMGSENPSYLLHL